MDNNDAHIVSLAYLELISPSYLTEFEHILQICCILCYVIEVFQSKEGQVKGFMLALNGLLINDTCT